MPDLPGYVGIDVVPQAIERARSRHPDRDYRVSDIRDFAEDGFDLVILRDVIQHLTLEAGLTVVAKARAAGRYLLASTYSPGNNRGCSTAELMRGGAYSNDLTAPPFRLPKPVELIPDGYSYHDGDVIRDQAKFLGLWGPDL